jgi:hypothetical protein
VNRANAARKYAGDEEDMTTVLPRRVVVPFPNRRAPLTDAPQSLTPTVATPRAPAAPEPEPAPSVSASPAPAPAPVAERITQPSSRRSRRLTGLTNPRVLAAGVGALGMIFGLGILVGHLVSSRPAAAAVAIAPPSDAIVTTPTLTIEAKPSGQEDEAQPAAPADATEAAKPDSVDAEQTKPQIVVTFTPRKEHAAARRTPHAANASGSHTIIVAAASKHVATKRPAALAAAPPATRAPGETAEPSAADAEAANAADKLARAQLEAVMR